MFLVVLTRKSKALSSNFGTGGFSTLGHVTCPENSKSADYSLILTWNVRIILLANLKLRIINIIAVNIEN